MQFNLFVDEACCQVERNEHCVCEMGVLSYITSLWMKLAARFRDLSAMFAKWVCYLIFQGLQPLLLEWNSTSRENLFTL
ncbi:hypothetical protein MKW98_016704, partial [Papaver atlanticum]